MEKKVLSSDKPEGCCHSYKIKGPILLYSITAVDPIKDLKITDGRRIIIGYRNYEVYNRSIGDPCFSMDKPYKVWIELELITETKTEFTILYKPMDEKAWENFLMPKFQEVYGDTNNVFRSHNSGTVYIFSDDKEPVKNLLIDLGDRTTHMEISFEGIHEMKVTPKMTVFAFNKKRIIHTLFISDPYEKYCPWYSLMNNKQKEAALKKLVELGLIEEEINNKDVKLPPLTINARLD